MSGARARDVRAAVRGGVRRWAIAPLLSMALGCGTSEQALDYGNPAAEGERERERLRLEVLTPVSGAVLRQAEASLEVRVADLEGGTPRFTLAYDGRVLFEEVLPGPEGVVRVPVSLLHGANVFRLRVSSLDGRRVVEQSWVVRYQGDAPGVRVEGWSAFDAGTGACDRPLLRPLTGQTAVCVRGRVSSTGSPVVRVEARAGDGNATNVVPGDGGTFVLPVTLRPDRMNRIELRALDDRGRATDTSTRILHDGTPPEIVLTSPSGGVAETLDGFWALEGTVRDPSGVATVCFDLRDTARACLPGTESFRWVTSLVPGANVGAVVARDTLGNEGRVEFRLDRVPAIRLRPPATTPARAVLGLDRTGLEALYSEEAQQDLLLAQVPLRAPLHAALLRLQDPAGSGIDTSVWGAAEWNLFRLLTVTPDTSDLSGTVFEEMTGVAAAIGLPPARVLAELLGVGIEEAVLPVEVLVDVLLEQGIGTHPNVRLDDDGEPVVDVTLYDALRSLEPLGPRFGPAGPHPGFLAAPPLGDVLEPGFLFTVEAISRLRGYECVDTSRRSKDYLFVAPTDGPAIVFDFDDPERFAVLGLVAEPEVTFTFTLQESPAFHGAGSDRTANPVDGRPGFARGDGDVWEIAPWLLERIVAEAGFRTFADRWRADGFTGTIIWSAGSIAEAARLDWDRGWVTIRTAGDLGNPPRPSFIWDALLEIAQVRLHDGGIAEGDANVQFIVPNVPVGLDADELIEAMRPLLRAQNDLLSDAILGQQGGVAVSTCDVALLEGGEALALVSADDDDLQAGFFADRGLRERISSQRLDGVADTTWHKVRPTVGATFYFRARGGEVWRLEVLDATDGEVLVLAEPASAAEGR